MSTLGRPLSYVFVILAAFSKTVLPIEAAGAQERSCGAPASEISPLLREAFLKCDIQGVHLVAAVVASDALIPLRQLYAAEPRRCPSDFYDAVTASLAKLQDQTYLTMLAERLNKRADQSSIRGLAFIADQQAIAILMAYFNEHIDQPLNVWMTDYWDDSPIRRIQIALIEDSGVRRILDLPPLYRQGLSERDYKSQWKEWWVAHDGHLHPVPYEAVDDPTLRCLARMVDWGFSNAVLQFPSYSESGKKLLQEFPRPNSIQKFGTIAGNISAAMAKSGDENQFAMIVSEAESGNLLDAREKLEYIGGKQSVDVIIRDLTATSAVLQAEESKERECVSSIEDGHRKSDLHIRKAVSEQCEKPHQATLLGRQTRVRADFGFLHRLLKDFPFQLSSESTPMEIQTWIDWWIKNKDSANFAHAPATSYE